MSSSCRHAGKHVFHGFDDMADGIAVAAHFLATGVLRGDVCILFGDELITGRIVSRIPPVIADPESSPQTVVRVNVRDFFGQGATRPFAGLLSLRDRLIGSALAEGRQCRIVILPAGDASATDVWDRTEVFESLFIGRVAPPETVTTLCLYERARYSCEMLELASAAHPWCIENGQIVRNADHARFETTPDRRVHQVA